MQNDSPLRVSDALTKVLQIASSLPPEVSPLATHALGMILAEDIESDLDMPPYDKSLMDGYAVRASDLPNGKGQLRVIEEITAGMTPTKMVEEGQSARIMTGAPIPGGVDAVVMHERTTLTGDLVEINDASLKAGQNILRQGTEMKKGEVVLKAGTMIRPEEMGVLAAVGKTAVKLIPPPKVTIISTGDELVEPMQMPAPGQIRNSNGPLLMGLVSRAGGLPRYLGIARDDVEHLRSLIKEGLEAPVLLLSGGVSAGKMDLVPGVLQEQGVESVFHKVQLKPGKPLFFGFLKKEGRPSTLVFGLPGNPVSTLVCFELFVRSVIRKLRGEQTVEPTMIQAPLTASCSYKTDRPTYHPALLRQKPEGREVEMVAWQGSPDLRAMTRANALVVLSPGEHQYQAGQMLTVLPLM